MKSNKKLTALALLILITLSGCAAPVIPGNSLGSDSYPLIVIGGEPEGIAAAVSAARNGVKTLLLEDDEALGGLFTLGRLNFLDMNYGPDEELLTRGIFEEFYKEMGNAFDIEEAKGYFLELVQKEKNITLKLGTEVLAPILEGGRITGVRVLEQGIVREYKAARVIDATVDADVAAAAGVPFTIGAEDYGQKDSLMGVTLVFRVKKVNWPYVFFYNNLSRIAAKFKACWGDANAGATWKVAWGYGKQALAYEPQDKNMRLRGPNMARQKDGTVLINALLIFGVDGLDPAARAAGIERGKEELPYILEFMRGNFPGFAQVELVDTAEQLYVRETRHMQGEYRLTIDDLLECRNQWDRIAHGSYPVDIQPVAPDNLGNVIGKPAIYSIPFRSIVPLLVEDLLVVGRSASYDSLPHGSVRVVPVGMAVGEAAGVAAAYSLEEGLGFRAMASTPEALQAVQNRLQAQGAYLEAYVPPKLPIMEHWAYSGLKTMRGLGLAAGGYSNNYGLENIAQYWDADFMLNRVLERYWQLRPELSYARNKAAFPENMTRGDLLTGVARLLSGQELGVTEAKIFLRQKGILQPELEKHMADTDSPPNFAELYMLLGRVYEILTGSEAVEAKR